VKAPSVPGARVLLRGGIIAALLLFGLSAAYAQIIFGGFGGGRPRWARVQDFDGSFVYCRGFYTSVYGEAGGQGWSTDYPAADNNFSVRLAELTRVFVKKDENRYPTHVVVELTDPLLLKCPILFMEDVGTMRLEEDEVKGLRDYMLKGGFVWVDDFWGTNAWSVWEHELRRVLPSTQYKMVDIPKDHPIMRTLYAVPEIPQVPSINSWRRMPGETSERGYDSATVHFRGIEDETGRLMVIMTHNTDIADTWEREGEEPREYFHMFSPRGYAVGVNVVVYVMTH
jgi:Domain of unknown function (DUF4159)